MAISYHIYNNFRNYKEFRVEFSKKLNQLADEIPMITFNYNFNQNIPIKEYAIKAFKDGELERDVEISMTR